MTDGAQWSQMKRDIAYFDASLPIEEASTPPGSKERRKEKLVSFRFVRHRFDSRCFVRRKGNIFQTEHLGSHFSFCCFFFWFFFSNKTASWYTDPAFLTLEKKAIFDNNWQYACHVDNLKVPGDFYAGINTNTNHPSSLLLKLLLTFLSTSLSLLGSLLGEHFVVVRGEDNKLRAFYNVCRHHATILSPPGITTDFP